MLELNNRLTEEVTDDKPTELLTDEVIGEDEELNETEMIEDGSRDNDVNVESGEITTLEADEATDKDDEIIGSETIELMSDIDALEVDSG